MFYKFPKIDDIGDVLAAINGREEFIVKMDTGNRYGVVNYAVNFEDTFPIVADDLDEAEYRRRTLLRECRGLTFDLNTGRVLARKYHKFHNVGEREETQPNLIDFSRDHVVLEKLDGSMLTPLVVNGGIRMATKLGLTEISRPVDEWVADHDNYQRFMREMVDSGLTPIFEWCSRKQRIIIDYPTDRLVLTAVRDNETGEYFKYSEMLELAHRFKLDLVRTREFQVDDVERFLNETRQLEGEEGHVVRFETGHMVKVKADQYVMLHRTTDNFKFEKDVIRIILSESLDDVKPLLNPDLVSRADAFGRDMFKNMRQLAARIYRDVRADYDNMDGSKKQFAAKVLANQSIKDMVHVYFQVWDRIALNGDVEVDEVTGLIANLVGKNTSSQTKVNEVRHFFGDISWSQYSNGFTLDD